MSLSRKLSKHYPKIPGYRLLRPRRCQVFGIGSPKTGTHSLVSVFAKNFRASHEAEVNEEIDLCVRYRQGFCHPGEIEDWFIKRNHRLWLDCDVSHLHGHFAAEIARALPAAKFILTIRDPLSWLDSTINQTLGQSANSHWVRLRHEMYGALPDAYPAQESSLQVLGLHPISNYLDRWAERFERVIQSIPGERLLVVKTEDLVNSTARIAEFCQIEPNLLFTHQAHKFQAAQKFGVLERVDRQYLAALIETRYGSLIRRYFSA